MPVVNRAEIAFQISDDLCSLDGDSHQTAECCILNGERWKGTQHLSRGKEEVEANTYIHTTEGGEAVMVGLHPFPAWYWQEQKALHTYMHTHVCTHKVMPPNNLSPL